MAEQEETTKYRYTGTCILIQTSSAARLQFSGDSMDNNTAKVSFAVRSKPSSKQNLKLSQNQNDEEEDRPKKQFVTEFDPSKTLADSKKPRRIIPPKAPTESRLHSRMRNLELAISQSNKEVDQLQWELEKKSAEADNDASQVSYGLNLRTTTTTANNNNGSSIQDAAAGPTMEPFEKTVSKDFRQELERLPEDEGFGQFDDMPVEEFGAALLGGLGWYEGRGIGKNSKGNVKIKEFGKRSFVSDDVVIIKDKKKDDLKKLNESRSSQIGDGDKQVNKHHQESEKQVDKRSRESERREGDKRSRESERRDNDKRIRESERREDNNKFKVGVPWLQSHIRVRIISKEFKRGRLYLKKGEVVDVVGPTTCDISMDESGELIQGVGQDLLETALPRRGGPVLVLNGRHKGVYGDLVDRDLDRETGVVRDADTHELLNVRLEQIAEYIGDPSYIGY